LTEAEPEEDMPPYVIEGARSSRSKCKTCRRAIQKDTLRIGMLVVGPFGPGYLWHHLKCAARRQLERVEEAYELEAWKEAKVPPTSYPPLDELAKLREEAVQKKKEARDLPYAELDPSGRASCKHCGESMAKGELRLALERRITFGKQERVMPILVHSRCAAAELLAEDCLTDPSTLSDLLRANSRGVDEKTLEALAAEFDAADPPTA
jgi:hypothetical protein